MCGREAPGLQAALELPARRILRFISAGRVMDLLAPPALMPGA